jgi:hypothetical protein
MYASPLNLDDHVGVKPPLISPNLRFRCVSNDTTEPDDADSPESIERLSMLGTFDLDPDRS